MGLSRTRNKNGTFLSKLTKFIDVRNRSRTQLEILKNDDIANRRGETHRNMGIALQRLNDKQYTEFD